MRRKTGKLVSKILDKFFKKNLPQKVEIDLGKEFWNKETLRILDKYGIQYFTVYSDNKGAIVERYNRTQKTKLFRSFTQNGNHKWAGILDQLTAAYNNRVHSSTKFAPVDVNKRNEHIVRNNLYPKQVNDPSVKPKFKVGNSVRLSRKDNIFSKGYSANFTDEIFYISEIKDTKPVTYAVKTFDGDIIKGSFYERELLLVNKSSEIYPIDRIIKKRRTSSGVQLLVSWRGYPESANSWIPESDLYPIDHAT